MDFTKYPLEKVFHLVAGLIPGFVALLIFKVGNPSAFDWFFALPLGYQTKLLIALFTAAIIGNSLTAFLGFLLGAIGGVLGAIRGMRRYKRAHTYPVAPWRDGRWRSLVARQLGQDAPRNSQLMAPSLYQQRRKLIDYLPDDQQPMAILNLDSEKLNAQIDDTEWERLYDHYHRIILDRDRPDFTAYVKNDLDLNMQAASLCALVSLVFVPELRHWWYILPAGFWTLLLVARGYSDWRRFTDKWFTLSDQLEYLDENPAAKQAASKPAKTGL